jgi:type II secretory pathway pseudopilin PulG
MFDRKVAMSIPKKLANAIQSLYKQILKLSRELRNKLMSWLLRTLLVRGSRSRIAQAGFVLPTVVMVILVVILVTTAIMFRSFDRSKNASNYRVNQAVLNAATPALDRAKKKIDELFASPNTRGTASELTLKDEFAKPKYKFADEDRLQLKYTPAGPDGEITEAWRFPVDTDNNGKFDSFTLYSILYSTPPRDTKGNPARKRNPIEARTPPMSNAAVRPGCEGGAGTSASLVGDSDWYKTGSRLKKPFFTYVATVPITNLSKLGLPVAQYENYSGNKGFSALEYQQDRSVLPPSNNAVVYEDDLDIFSGPGLRLNGRIFTNSNLFVAKQTTGNDIRFYQVSSPESCYYDAENAKIVVGGNVLYGDATTTAAGSANVPVSGSVNLDLYVEDKTPITTTLSATDQSVKEYPAEAAYNNQAYEERIAELVKKGVGKAEPQEVTETITDLQAANPALTKKEAREKALELYFRNRTRRVPFKEVAVGGNAAGGVAVQGDGDKLRPPNSWMYPFAVDANGNTPLASTANAKVTLKTAGNKLLPKATDPDALETQENFVGDRVLIGNNLPARWYKNGEFVTPDTKQEINNTEWDAPDNAGPRSRQTRAEPVRELDVTDRDGFWERKTAEIPTKINPGVGGVRIITSAGVYRPPIRPNATPNFNTSSKVVWPDTMPMMPLITRPNDDPQNLPELQPSWRDSSDPFPKDKAATPKFRPYLQMRATAVYHYATAKDPKNAKPIACVSSFYDPTSGATARNIPRFASRDLRAARYDVSGTVENKTLRDTSTNSQANSLNGIVYRPIAAPSSLAELTYQAQLVYPNGRPVNELLKEALATSAPNRSLAQKAAIDSTSCALQILKGTLAPDDGSLVPHAAIQEVAFLDARQIKLIDKKEDYKPEDFAKAVGGGKGVSKFTENKYDLPIEERQPLEIRATVVDLNLLRNKKLGTNALGIKDEYMIPQSGIIYATREDALPDKTAENLKISATDFKLDPTRRPNAILLVNGKQLNRNNNNNDYRKDEKGLILASNLPVYVKGEFNHHDFEEFTNKLDSNWGDFYTRTAGAGPNYAGRDPNFACRAKDPRLPSCTKGDKWRSATVIADATTLLSDGFRFGFRNEGDYDLRNNQIDNIEKPNEFFSNGSDTTITIIEKAETIRANRLAQGFWDNNFVTNGLSSGTFSSVTAKIGTLDTGSSLTGKLTDALYSTNKPNVLNSSYFNNFITPIQRRGEFPEYVMEICPKLPVSECEVGDWIVGGGTASDLVDQSDATALAGTTARPPTDPKDQRFARRIAFLRNGTGDLDLSSGGLTVLGIKDNKIQKFPFSASDVPEKTPNALWYRTSNGGSPSYRSDKPLLAKVPTDLKAQPELVPVLQLQVTNLKPLSSGNATIEALRDGSAPVEETQWLARAKNNNPTDPTTTRINMVMATGDNPSRPKSPGDIQADLNGGLANLPHFLENWKSINGKLLITNMSGSFIQFKRSNYATAPWWSTPPVFIPNSLPFNYPQTYKTGSAKYSNANFGGKLPYFYPPDRQWGFDVGLLSQTPDLFSQQFTLKFTDEPNEYFREVPRDDDWVKALLCAKTTPPGIIRPAINDEQRPKDFCSKNTGG